MNRTFAFQSLAVEFRVAPENAVFVKSNTPLALQISGKAFVLRKLTVKSGNQRRFFQGFGACFRKRVSQTLDHLEQRQIGITQTRAHQVQRAVLNLARIARQNA